MSKDFIFKLMADLEEHAENSATSFDALDLVDYAETYNDEAVEYRLGDIGSWSLEYAALAAHAAPTLIATIRELYEKIEKLEMERDKLQNEVVTAKAVGGLYDK